MRVILKPAGLAVVLVTLGILTGITIFLSRWAIVNVEASHPTAAHKAALEKARAHRKSDGARGVLAQGPVTLAEGGAEFASIESLPADQLPKEAWEGFRIKVNTKPAKFHAVQVRLPISKPVPAERSMTLHFWARSTTKNRFSAFVGERDADYSRSFFVTVSPPTNWKLYTYTFTVPSLKPEKAELRLAAGHGVGEVDIAGFGLD